MPRVPTEFDTVEHHLHRAAGIIRDLQLGDVQTETLRTDVYKLIADAINLLAHNAYRDALSRGGVAGRKSSPSPASAAGRGGAAHVAKFDRDSLANDLADLLK
jgi:hypothetical protein